MKSKRLIFTLLLSLLVGAQAFAQQETWLSQIKEAGNGVTTIQAKLLQTKHIELLDQDVVSNGFLFFQDKKLSMVYEKPKGHQMIFNGDKFTIIKEGVPTSMNAKNNALLSELGALLFACMKGQIQQAATLQDAAVMCEMVKGGIQVTLTRQPKGNEKRAFHKMTATYDKNTKIINEIVLYEQEGTYTRYAIQEVTLNKSLNPAVFQPIK